MCVRSAFGPLISASGLLDLNDTGLAHASTCKKTTRGDNDRLSVHKMTAQTLDVWREDNVIVINFLPQ